MKHWATPLIGKPWAPDGEGPDRFSCWGLVRWVFRERWGIDMPAIRVGDFTEGENVAAIKQAAQTSGWRPAEGDAAPEDIVLMRGADGRHVGVMIETRRGPVLLHSYGHMTVRGPVGSVIAQPLRDAVAQGYCDLEAWRRA